MLDLPTFFTSWPQFAGACAVMFVAEATYVAFGFGAGLIAIGALAVIVPSVPDVVVMVLLVNVPLEIAVSLRSRQRIRWRGVLVVALAMMVGTPIGARLLRVVEPTFLISLLGATLIVIGVGFLSLPTDYRVRWGAWAAPTAGFSSGLLSGMFGTGGPPLILYYQLSGVDKAIFRGNLMAVFLLLNFVRLPSYLYEGLITAPRVGASVALLPAVALGALAGGRIHLELSEATFRRTISVVIAIIGAVILLSR